MPDQWDVEKNIEWYKQNGLFIAGQWNPVIETNYTTAKTNEGAGKQTPDTGRWADKCIRNYQYYFGEQNNIAYGYWVRDYNNKPLPARLINGQTIYELCKHIQGYLYDTYIVGLPKRIGVSDVTPDYLEEQNQKFTLAKMYLDMKYAGMTADENTVSFNPIEGINLNEIETAEKLERYRAERPSQAIERIFTGAAKKFLNDINWKEKFKKITDYLLPTGFARVKVCVKNGKLYLYVYRPEQCIYDTTVDDDFGRTASYWGVVHYYSIPELFSEYTDLTDTEKKDLQEISRSNSPTQVTVPWFAGANVMIGSSGYNWYDFRSSVPRVGVVEAYWKGLDKDGKEIIERVDIIGNQIIKRAGKDYNLIEDKVNKANVEPPFLDYHPDMIGGKNKSLVDRVCNISDRIDGLQAKIDLFINRAKGKVILINANELPDDVGVKEVMSDLSSMGGTVIQGVDIDSAREQYGERLITLADMTLDYQGIVGLRNEIEALKREAKAIVSVPDAALGQAVPQGSNKELMNTINQASFGLSTFNDGFLTYENNICQRAVDLQKIVWTINEESHVLDLGERDYQLVKFTKDISLKDMHLFIDQDDAITPEVRRYYMDLGFNLSQGESGGDYASLLAVLPKVNSVREMETLFKSTSRRIDMKKQMQAERELAAQQQNVAQQTQTAENVANTQVEGNLEKEAMKTERDVMLKQMDSQNPQM